AGGEGGVAAAAADQGKPLILMPQLLNGGDGGSGVAAIVLTYQLQLAAVNAAGGIDVIEHHLDAVHRQLAVEIAGSGQGPEAANLDAVGGDPRLVGQRRQRDGDERQSGKARKSQVT